MRTKTLFILELPLKTTPVQESTILVRLDTGRQLYNACLGEGLKRLALIQQSKEYQRIITLPKTKEPVLSGAVLRAYKTAIGRRNPASFGFSGTQSQSGSLVKPATIISEAMDVVIHQTMDESHRELI